MPGKGRGVKSYIVTCLAEQSAAAGCLQRPLLRRFRRSTAYDRHLRVPARRPEARARCGSAARRDLCGGCWVTGIPTATFPTGIILESIRI
jgi:hypothetical protein